MRIQLEGFFMMAIFPREVFAGERSVTSDSRKHPSLSITFFLEDRASASSFFKALKTLGRDPIPRFDATHFPTS